MKKVKVEAVFYGLTQSFKDSKGQSVFLKDILTEQDWWTLTKNKQQLTIITHSGVKKLAWTAGLFVDVEPTDIQPTIHNGMTTVIKATVTDKEGNKTVKLGESSRGNLGLRGKGNPVNMAEKRAYDRAVLEHLQLVGILGEDELPDDNEETTLMDTIKTDEEKKAIAPICNEIWAAKDKATLMKIKEEVKKVESSFSAEQMNTIKGLWKKQSAALEKF
jgi:hypothetical protein